MQAKELRTMRRIARRASGGEAAREAQLEVHRLLDLAKAQIAFARRDDTAARKHLDAAKPGFSVPKAEAYQVRAVSMLDSALLAREAARRQP